MSEFSERTERIADALAAKATVEFHYSYSDIPIEGNALVSGDDEVDAAECKRIRDDLEAGNIAAWFDVECRATWAGIRSSSYLGGCSYETTDDFENEPSGYAADLRAEAIEGLARSIADVEQQVSNLLAE